jgi:hypothetical protein
MDVKVNNYAPEVDALEVQVFAKARDGVPAVEVSISRGKTGTVTITVANEGRVTFYRLGQTKDRETKRAVDPRGIGDLIRAKLGQAPECPACHPRNPEESDMPHTCGASRAPKCPEGCNHRDSTCALSCFEEDEVR